MAFRSLCLPWCYSAKPRSIDSSSRRLSDLHLLYQKGITPGGKFFGIRFSAIRPTTSYGTADAAANYVKKEPAQCLFVVYAAANQGAFS